MKDIQITSSPWGFRKTSLEQQCRWLEEHGFKYICGQLFEDMPGLFTPDITDKQINGALLLTKKYGLSYASFNANGDFTVYEDVDAQIELCCREIDKASKFKPEIIIVFAGWVEREDDAVYDQVASALKIVSKHAAQYGLTVALENHGGLTRTVSQCNRILTAVDEPNVGLNYDPANFLMYGEDPYISLQEIDCPIVFTHLKSLNMLNGKKEYCRLNEGKINYLPILKWLKQNYDGFYALEYEETSDVFEGTLDDLHSLEQLLAEIEDEPSEQNHV